MFQYQQTHRYFAQIAHGLEDEGARELQDLGAQNVTTAYRGLHFDADTAAFYRIHYGARLVTQVLAPLLTFDCHSDRYLYKTAQQIDWTAFLSVDETFAVFANVAHSKITHSKYAALRLKDAVVDQFRDRFGRRPSIDTQEPDLWLNLYIHDNRAVISVATSGGSLHRRAYRTASVEAPMQETVAAAHDEAVALEHAQVAFVRRQADDRVQRGGLAGTVGPDEAEHLAVAEVEADAVDRGDAPIALDQVAHLDTRGLARRQAEQSDSVQFGLRSERRLDLLDLIQRRLADGRPLFLLIRDSYHNWGFPKGHLESGEAPDW